MRPTERKIEGVHEPPATPDAAVDETGSSAQVAEDEVERIYDEFIEAALSGRMPAPEEMLAACAHLDEGTRALLGERLASIAELVPARETSAEEDLGELGEYRLLSRLGSGAMGNVYLAEDKSLRRLVALKTMRAELAGSSSARLRFEREARALGKLKHPAVVGVHGFFEVDGVLGIAMELVPGRSLKEVLVEGQVRLSAAEVVAIAAQLARGLEAVHAAGLLHRDVKPSNVRISADGRAVLVDFGLARVPGSSELSLTGEFIGSPAYASPEQVRGSSELDARTDVYSLGATLYHALCGQAPFEGTGFEAVLQAVLQRDPPLLRQVDAELSEELETICAKAMEKEPGRRYASAAELAEDLEAVLELRPIRARPAGRGARMAKWARRNPALTASMGVALVSMLLLVFGLGWTRREARVERLASAATSLERAEQAVERYRASRAELDGLDTTLGLLAKQVEFRRLGLDELAQIDAAEDAVELAAKQRETAAATVGQELGRALQLDPSLEEAAAGVWAELYLAKLAEALGDRDRLAVRFYLEELERYDPDGSLRASALPFSSVTVTAARPDVRAWLFRRESLHQWAEGRDRRLVPMPWRAGAAVGEPPVPYGERVLEVLEPAGGLLPGDLVLDVEGQSISGGPFVVEALPGHGLEPGDRFLDVDGEPLADGWDLRLALRADEEGLALYRLSGAAGLYELSLEQLRDAELNYGDAAEWVASGGRRGRVWSDGQVTERELPEGLVLQATAAPLFASAANELALPAELSLEPGEYLLVSSAPGSERVRTHFELGGASSLAVELDPLDRSALPAGFVRVSVPAANLQPVWMGRYEVTAEEYLEFLNDPATLAEVDAAVLQGLAVRYPRGASNFTDWGLWERTEEGPFELSEGWSERWPVIGISWDDALAYAGWRTRRDGRGRYRLASLLELMSAGGGAGPRYAWGDRFDQRFANTCFSRAAASPQDVGNNPVDEGPAGAFDLTGNAAEWIDGWFDEARGFRHAAGGSWGQSQRVVLSIGGGNGFPQHGMSGETGVRLMWEPDAAEGSE